MIGPSIAMNASAMPYTTRCSLASLSSWGGLCIITLRPQEIIDVKPLMAVFMNVQLATLAPWFASHVRRAVKLGREIFIPDHAPAASRAMVLPDCPGVN